MGLEEVSEVLLIAFLGLGLYFGVKRLSKKLK